MKRRGANVMRGVDNDAPLTVLLPAAQKRKLQAQLTLAGSSWTEFARTLAQAYLQGKPITVAGKPLADVLHDESGS